MVGKIYLEFLVNARVVHVVIHAEPSDVTRLSFQPLEIAIDGKVICNWSETSLPVLIPSSITSVRHVCSDGLFHASFNTKPSLIPNLIDHTILITHHKADQPTSINCRSCHYRLLEYKFKRCLSLPSDGWSEMMGDVFCHDHEGDSIQHHLIPNKDDLFYGEDTNTIHLLTDLLTGSVLIQPTDNIRMLRCKRCLEYIGTASSDVQYNTARLDLIKVCCSNFDVVSLQKIVALKMIKLSQELCCYNFVITTNAAHHERVIEIRSLRSITWMLMDSIKPKTGGPSLLTPGPVWSCLPNILSFHPQIHHTM
jgi:hypothetical protein